MPESKRPEPKRRSPGARPAKGGDNARKKPRPVAARRERPAETRSANEPAAESITASIAAAAVRQSEQRLGFTARRAAILAAVICVLTLTIAGPVGTYFAQRTEMKQLAASEAKLRQQIDDLKEQKAKLADPVFIAAQARERLGFVMPGDVPYQVQLPPGTSDSPGQPELSAANSPSSDPWYTALWRTISDSPHNLPQTPPPAPPPPPPGG